MAGDRCQKKMAYRFSTICAIYIDLRQSGAAVLQYFFGTIAGYNPGTSRVLPPGMIVADCPVYIENIENIENSNSTCNLLEERNFMKAIVLAAGRGSRLGIYTADRPKTLVDVGGKALLQRNLENIKGAGFEKVALVLGYRHEMIEEHLERHFPRDFYKVILNPDYTRGSGSSLMCAAEEFEGDVVIIESDLLYHPGVLMRMANGNGENAMAMGNFNHGRREVKLYLDAKRIRHAAWGEPDDQNAAGDWVGFTRLSPICSRALKEMLLAADPEQGKEFHYEDFIFRLIAQFPFNPVYIQDLPWIEIDNAQDYERARQEIGPRIDGLIQVGSVA